MKKALYFVVGIVCFLGLGPFIVIKANESKPLLHFVQLSDTHLNDAKAKDAERLLGSSEKLLTSAVDEINKIKDLDFVLGTGDLVDVPKEKLVDRYIEITMSLKYPLYVLLGNHDVSVNGGLGKKGFIKKFTKLEPVTSFTGDMTYYSFSPNKKFTVICLDGTTDKVVTAHGQLDDEQFEWLKKELDANKDKYVIIAIHFPPIEPYKSNTHFFLEPDETKFLSLVNSHNNVIGVFSGHYHAARLFKIKNKIHCSCPSTIQYPLAFREVTISEASPKYIEVGFKWHEVGDKELREKSRSSSRSWALTQGAEEDREQNIKLRVY